MTSTMPLPAIHTTEDLVEGRDELAAIPRASTSAQRRRRR